MTPGDWSGLRELSRSELLNRLMVNVDALLDGHLGTAEAEDARLAELPEALQALWYVSCVDFEVSQGSMIAYAFNSHGRHARAAAAAFRELGLASVGAILDDVALIRDRTKDAWESRHEELDALAEHSVVRAFADLPGAEELDALAARFRGALDETDWGGALETMLVRTLPSVEAWASAE